MTGGTYTLVIERTESAPLDVGALGERAVPAGWYAYTGSALGPGGFARVQRHERVAAREHDVRHWHVDYLLGDPDASLAEVVESPGVEAECAVARDIEARVGGGEGTGGDPVDRGSGSGATVPGFGCSDCDCSSHLASHPDRPVLRDAVDEAHRTVRSSDQ